MENKSWQTLAQIQLVACFCKPSFFADTAMPIRLCIVYGCLGAASSGLSSCDTWYLAAYRKSLGSSDLEYIGNAPEIHQQNAKSVNR